MAIIDWPRNAFKVSSENWHLEGLTVSTGGILRGGTFVDFENRVWRVRIPARVMVGDEWRQVRALFDNARGQVNEIRVPVLSDKPNAIERRTRTFKGGKTFSNGATFGTPDLTNVRAEEDAPEGATEILLNVSPYQIALTSIFSAPGDKIYRVSGSNGGRVTFVPPLRRAIKTNDKMEFLNPVARMRLTIDNAFVARGPATDTASRGDLDLVEAL